MGSAEASMRKATALLAMWAAFAAAMAPVAMANVRALHLCCPPRVQATATQHDAMEHCEHAGMAPGSGPALQSDMSDCSRHMLSTAAPGVVHPSGYVVVGRPAASHPILDEFAPLFATDANHSSQQDRAPPANGQ